MVDVLRLVSGELVTQTDPADWVRILNGEVVTVSGSGDPALQLSTGERITVTGPVAATVDCAALKVCAVGVTGGACNTGARCSADGEAHRIGWDETGCVDANHHIALRASENGGTFIDIGVTLACNAADNDDGCCSFLNGACVPDGQFRRLIEKDNGTAQTTDWQYAVRIQNDSDSSLVDSLNTNTEVDKGGNDICLGA